VAVGGVARCRGEGFPGGVGQEDKGKGEGRGEGEGWWGWGGQEGGGEGVVGMGGKGRGGQGRRGGEEGWGECFLRGADARRGLRACAGCGFARALKGGRGEGEGGGR